MGFVGHSGTYLHALGCYSRRTLVDRIVGHYENHSYDNTPTKNDWHYITISKIDDATLNVKTRAGPAWILKTTDTPNRLTIVSKLKGHEKIFDSQQAEVVWKDSAVSEIIMPQGTRENHYRREGGPSFDEIMRKGPLLHQPASKQEPERPVTPPEYYLDTGVSTKAHMWAAFWRDADGEPIGWLEMDVDGYAVISDQPVACQLTLHPAHSFDRLHISGWYVREETSGRWLTESATGELGFWGGKARAISMWAKRLLWTQRATKLSAKRRGRRVTGGRVKLIFTRKAAGPATYCASTSCSAQEEPVGSVMSRTRRLTQKPGDHSCGVQPRIRINVGRTIPAKLSTSLC